MDTSLTASQPAELTRAAIAPHEHAWRTESAHSTSEGRVLYVRCVDCGIRRVDLQAFAPRLTRFIV